MIIDLKEHVVFEDDSIDFSKKCNFVFGKNGTGKSTLTRLITEQCKDYDVKIFEGFEKILGDNEKLNAVVLGEENLLISEKIKDKNEIIEKKREEKKIILKKIEPPKGNEENLWTSCKIAEDELNKKEKEINDFFKKAAASIKNMQNPQVSITSYNINNFKEEIQYAKLLAEVEKIQCEENCKSDIKVAKMLMLPVVDLQQVLNSVNDILLKKVEEKIKIARINSEDKRMFARRGCEIHEKGDRCAFCGHIIEDDTFIELEKYFSADEVVDFQNEIEEKIAYISKLIGILREVEIDIEDFYLAYREDVIQIKREIEEISIEQEKFLQLLIDSLSVKKGNMFLQSSPLEVIIPRDFKMQKEKYQKVVEENNKNDLLSIQQKAKSQLRFHYIQEALDNFDYKAKIMERDHLEKQYIRAQKELKDEQDKIWGVGGIDEQINQIQKEIDKLQSQTKSEELLAKNINRRLKHKVSFELEYCKQEPNMGYYHVKCLRNGIRRDITKLSAGEKNIIAFLYFIEKLDELIEGVHESKDRIIIFDDPMTSNDDNMQYLIINELQLLMNKMKETDKFILLTHNNHFYLNVEYPKKYGKNSYIHLLSNGRKTKIKTIENKNQDFKTSYAGLWEEVKFLYQSEASPELLLNPIRRIIETYTKFNVLDTEKFYDNNKDALKLFHVNSHSIDDLEADLNGKSKEEIIQMLKDCFSDNYAEEHFNSYWIKDGEK